MVKFKGFLSEEGGIIEGQVNEWLQKEQPKMIYSSNLYVDQVSGNSFMTVFYEANKSANYMNHCK